MTDVTPAGTVNSQIVDSVASVVTLTTGQAPSQAFGMLDAVMVESLGMAMHNAVMRQQGASMVGSAAVTAACAKMLQGQTTYEIPIPPPPPKPPEVDTLQGPPPPIPPAPQETGLKEGEDAIQSLSDQATQAATEASLALNSLKQIASDASAAAAKLTAIPVPPSMDAYPERDPDLVIPTPPTRVRTVSVPTARTRSRSASAKATGAATPATTKGRRQPRKR